MSQLIQMNLEEGATITVEVDEAQATLEPVSRKSPKEIVSVERFFDKVTSDQIVASCTGIIDAFRRLKDQDLPPQKASAEFGLQFNIEGNAYVVKATTDASIKVTLEWNLA